ncbi:MAG: argininosuccinate synthase [Deltaproteobacteria bacterium]|nr:argininosuccinate synthase [Deltaproteobacteria bacterium]
MTKDPRPVTTCVLAYSGGLDTSIIIPWLKEHYGCRVVAYAADLGQGDLDPEKLEQKALATGADRAVIQDLREEFLRDYIFPMMQAGAQYEERYLLGTAIARPLIARRMMEVVEEENADAVAHGCTGKGNDQVRFELTFRAFNPYVRIISPWRLWDIKSREDAIEYARERNVPVDARPDKIYSHDANLWHISSEGGTLEDPWRDAPEEIYHLTKSPFDAPDTPATLTLEFEGGVPVALDGERIGPVELLKRLNAIGGEHGVGRVDIVENRLVGMKSRGVYETPGGSILYAAHHELQSLVLDAETMHYKESIAPKYAEIIYNGLYFTPLREAIDAFVASTQHNVTGEVRLMLYKGNILVRGRRSPYSLYREDFATFGKADVYDQVDAKGFIELYGLPIKIRSLIEHEGGERLKGYRAPNYSKFKRD